MKTTIFIFFLIFTFFIKKHYSFKGNRRLESFEKEIHSKFETLEKSVEVVSAKIETADTSKLKSLTASQIDTKEIIEENAISNSYLKIDKEISADPKISLLNRRYLISVWELDTYSYNSQKIFETAFRKQLDIFDGKNTEVQSFIEYINSSATQPAPRQSHLRAVK